jgi:hypothetical protein
MKNKKYNIEVKEIHNPLPRILAVLLLLCVGMTAIGLGLKNLFSKDSGWTQIQTTENTVLSDSFEFNYYLDKNPLAEFKQLSKIYTGELKKEAAIFDPGYSNENCKNLYYLNHNLNRLIELEPQLYDALKKFYDSDNRDIFLGEIYKWYDRLFLCSYDYETEGLDPYNDKELKKYFAQLAEFAKDKGSIDIEFMPEYRVKVNVSEEYLNFMAENEIDTPIDFYWYKNAIIADNLAEALTDSGYRRGYILTKDGYIRNLQKSDEKFSLFLYDRDKNTVRDVATITLTGRESAVYYHSYRLKNQTGDLHYVYSDGTSRNPYVDINDGLCKSALDDLLVYSYGLGCLDIRLKTSAFYITDGDFTAEKILNMGIYPVFTLDKTIYSFDNDAEISQLFSKDGVKYNLFHKEK